LKQKRPSDADAPDGLFTNSPVPFAGITRSGSRGLISAQKEHPHG